MLSQPTGSSVGGITVDGLVGRVCGGRGEGKSAIGGGVVEEDPGTGKSGGSLIAVSSVTGPGTVTGLSVDSAVHPVCTSPVVPKGHRQIGECSTKVQSESMPQVPKLQTS